jgi:hypothetical protein
MVLCTTAKIPSVLGAHSWVVLWQNLIFKVLKFQILTIDDEKWELFK